MVGRRVNDELAAGVVTPASHHCVIAVPPSAGVGVVEPASERVGVEVEHHVAQPLRAE